MRHETHPNSNGRDRPDPAGSAAAAPQPPGARAVLFAGIAGACALGVGLGLWARPAALERLGAVAPPEGTIAAPPPTTRKLEIVVDDRPAPVGAPIQVLPGGAQSPPETSVPRRPPEGLIKADVPTAAAAAQPPAARRVLAAVIPAMTAAAAATEAMIAKAGHTPHAQVAKAPTPQAGRAASRVEPMRVGPVKAHRIELAQAGAKRAGVSRVAALRTERIRERTARAEADRAAAERGAHREELAREARAETAEKLRLARAQARAKAAQREEARLDALAEAAAKTRGQLARLAHARATAVERHARQMPVEIAKAERKPARKAREAKVEQASLKGRKARQPPHLASTGQPVRLRPEPMAPRQGDGLVKVSTSPRCASRDPGEALVCADPSLGAADRQLARAIQGARAAGVPDAQLRQQQQRWLAARSAAAREAPWAVRDVYMARIAELNGQAKEAQGGY